MYKKHATDIRVGHFDKDCHQRPHHHTTPPSARLIHVKPAGKIRPQYANLSNIRVTHVTELVPTDRIHITALNGTANTDSLQIRWLTYQQVKHKHTDGYMYVSTLTTSSLLEPSIKQ